MLRNTPKALLLCSIALATMTASAREDVSEIAAQADQIKKEASTYLKDFNARPTPSDEVVKLAEEVMNSSRQAAERGLTEVSKQFGIELPKLDAITPTGEWIDILVSRSLGEELIQTIQALEDSKVPVRFVFRGIDEGQRINDAFADYGRWTHGLEKPPAAILDPNIFREHAVTAVPHMIYMKDGKALANVRGLSNPQWLADAVARGERGDLGSQGPVMEIAERDLIEVMQERAAGLDLESRKEETVKTYWERASFTELAAAERPSRRTIDPTVVVARALKDRDGNVIVPAGAKINPLDMRPFTLRLVVFNPTRKSELNWVKSLEPVPGIEDMYLATAIDRDDGWKHLERIEDALDAPVFLLKPDIRDRFGLRSTPSLVTAEERHFVVEELVPERGPEHDAR
jgi:conjugal transfer pilus assembly protein TraW